MIWIVNDKQMETEGQKQAISLIKRPLLIII